MGKMLAAVAGGRGTLAAAVVSLSAAVTLGVVVLAVLAIVATAGAISSWPGTWRCQRSRSGSAAFAPSSGMPKPSLAVDGPARRRVVR
jgi:hypothetical protein